MKHLLKDANGVGNYTPYVDYSGSTITFQNTIWNKVKRNLVLWYDIKRQGATNENMANNPILKDLSGNGHDATCYNFAWKGMSGIGGEYTNFAINISRADAETLGTQKWLIKSLYNDVQATREPITSLAANFTGKGKTFIINIDGIPLDAEADYLKVVNNVTDWNQNLSNGNNTVTFSEDSEGYFVFRFLHNDISNITIEIFPEYPNALVSDGVDDYCRVNGLPILTDYTVIAKRKRLDIDLGHRGALASKLPQGSSSNGAFAFEYSSADDVKQAVSFGTFNIINFEETDISYQTKNYYNGVYIKSGNQLDTDHLSLFSIRENSGCAQAALYSFVLFNRTLTDEEIKKWIRQNMDENYLLPNERPEPIIYYDFRNGDNSNLNTVTDLSGNERHGTMYNFTGEADSGYFDGCLKFGGIDNYIEIPYSSDAVYKTVIMLLRFPGTGDGIVYEGRHYNPSTGGIALYYNKDRSPYLRGRLPEDAIVYINGVPNTIYTNIDMTQKKNCAAVTLDVFLSGDATYPPRIGTARGSTTYSVPMDLYAFLGFDKILTEEEIRYVMNKYNLLEGIDEI